MYDFQRELQTLNVGDFYANQAIPWDQNQYYSNSDDRQFGLIFSCFSCFSCVGCFGSCFGRCGGFGFCGGRCGGCGGRCGGHCGGCGGRCHR